MKEFPPRSWLIGFYLFMSGTGAGMMVADGLSWERAMMVLAGLGLTLLTWRQR